MDPDKHALRQRIEYEDGLLNTRTGIFLVANSLLGVANQLRPDVILVGFSCVISALWLIVGYKHFRVIGTLTRSYLTVLEKIHGDPVEKLVQDACKIWLPFRPTNVLSLWLPTIALVAWVMIAYNLISDAT